jgi:hypothetical protein
MPKIYESPDGGRTVRAREFGEPSELHQQMQEAKLWGNIQRMGRTDPGMRELLDRVIIYYNLKRDHGN